MIEERKVYIVYGKQFSSIDRAREYEAEQREEQIKAKKIIYVRNIMAFKGYGQQWSDWSYTSQEYVKPTINLLIDNTDLVQEIINNLKQNKWD